MGISDSMLRTEEISNLGSIAMSIDKDRRRKGKLGELMLQKMMISLLRLKEKIL